MSKQQISLDEIKAACRVTTNLELIAASQGVTISEFLEYLAAQNIDFNELLKTMQAKEKIDTLQEFKKRYKAGMKAAKMLMQEELEPFDRSALINQCCPAGLYFQYCQNVDDVSEIVGGFHCPEGKTPQSCMRRSLKAFKILVAKEQYTKVMEGNEKTLEFLAVNLLNQAVGAIEPFNPTQWVFVENDKDGKKTPANGQNGAKK